MTPLCVKHVLLVAMATTAQQAVPTTAMSDPYASNVRLGKTANHTQRSPPNARVSVGVPLAEGRSERMPHAGWQ